MKIKFVPVAEGKSFVGIKYIDNNIEVHYPRSFRWTKKKVISGESCIELDITEIDRDLSSDILMLIDTVQLAKTTSESESCAAEILSTTEEFALKAYLWLINDYMNNGLYKNRESSFRNDTSGQVNWKRTLQKQPFVSNGNVIYPHMVSTIKNDTDNILTEIYQHCLKKSIFLIGWLFNLDSVKFGVDSIEDIELPDFQKKVYSFYLNKELRQTFDDMKRIRLTNMLKIVNGLNNSKDKMLVNGVNEYNYVFEKMIDSIFGTEDVSNYYPRSIWKKGGTEKENTPLKPDTIIFRNKNCIIVDAKCYQYFFKGWLNGSFEGLPTTDSVQKQITYGDYVFYQVEKKEKDLFNKIDKDKIFNCFLLPYDKEYDGIAHKNIEYVMYADTNWKEAKRTYDRILVFFIDMRFVIENWNKRNHDEEIDDLIRQISDIMKETHSY